MRTTGLFRTCIGMAKKMVTGQWYACWGSRLNQPTVLNLSTYLLLFTYENRRLYRMAWHGWLRPNAAHAR